MRWDKTYGVHSHDAVRMPGSHREPLARVRCFGPETRGEVIDVGRAIVVVLFRVWFSRTSPTDGLSHNFTHV